MYNPEKVGAERIEGDEGPYAEMPYEEAARQWGSKFFQDDSHGVKKQLIAWLLFPRREGPFRYIGHWMIVDTLRLLEITAE